MGKPPPPPPPPPPMIKKASSQSSQPKGVVYNPSEYINEKFIVGDDGIPIPLDEEDGTRRSKLSIDIDLKKAYQRKYPPENINVSAKKIDEDVKEIIGADGTIISVYKTDGTKKDNITIEMEVKQAKKRAKQALATEPALSIEERLKAQKKALPRNFYG
jgi:hypothetical protein